MGLKIPAAKASSAKAQFTAKAAKAKKKVVKNGKPSTGAVKGKMNSYFTSKAVPAKTGSVKSASLPKSGKSDNVDKRLGAYMQSLKTAY
jgi:hypothetical protein